VVVVEGVVGSAVVEGVVDGVVAVGVDGVDVAVDVVDAVVDTGSPIPPPPPQADNVPTVPRMAVNITARLDLDFNL
jgi:hypothetical protein